MEETLGATAATIHGTLSKPDGKTARQETLLSQLNSFLSADYVSDWAYYGFWFVFWLFMPYVVLGGIVIMALYDAVTCKGNRKPVGPVLITGCDSGFGKGLALALSELGWNVYATCMTTDGVQYLAKNGKVTALRMDVTKEEDVRAVMAKVDAAHPKEGLYALVNNAGVDRFGTTDWCDVEHYRWHMEINFFGHVRMVKEALPLLKRAARHNDYHSSRILNITSFSGLLPGFFMKSAYGASKHAAESWSNSLRMELRHFGIQVCQVNPVWHRTEIAHSQRDHLVRIYESLSGDLQADYGKEYFLKLADAAYSGRQRHTWEPENVVKALVSAVTAERHRPQRVVGMDATFYMVPVMMLPRRIINMIYDRWALAAAIPAGALSKGAPTQV
ncbi:hypothetical protein NSK_000203 [Nannochloropsis salina CCMP1776]|jgi:NAD(P)-dependent dehydrogenase (short-subunit alcohol dehydrogenase family)|uniref:Uncharacterized protein n=1 Tax=Nannochloropsis salina CCMP1776 TaxID=1027361 RepID=A0A4D9DC65_9STRA|nr:hypothetical protein NSK_000203 [Nannochloropsis salina CCMP1776]|eukprot:TFJ88634.1 hypothetical protein NSK_000203 [Nannochloropsis salina CCMP1776]